MKGTLWNKHGWVIEYQTYSGPGKSSERSVPLHPESKEKPGLIGLEGSVMDFEMVKINPLGREVDPMDLTQNQSECIWVAKLTSNELFCDTVNTNRESEIIEVDKEYVLCAAVWYKDLPMKRPEVLDNRGFRPYNVDRGVVISGWRHANCIYQMVAITGLRSIPAEAGEEIQGFLTNKNRFVDRKEGGEIAFAAGQTTELKTTLYSEDLY
jgi:hypothetical protein